MAEAALDELLAGLGGDLDIGIFDATNTTIKRRDWIRAKLSAWSETSKFSAYPFFIESICTDDDIIRSNVRETKLKSPDYRGVPEDVAVQDFLMRIRHYVAVYQTMQDEEGSAYVKLIDVGKKIVGHKVYGFLPTQIMTFVSNLQIAPRQIWLTRHGESVYNTLGKIGGDSGLSPLGQEYSKRLAAFISNQYPSRDAIAVWTSTLKRTINTAQQLGREIVTWRALDEIDAGVCDGMTYKEIEDAMPQEFYARARDKYHYRYPRGESYQDIVARLEPVIHELMRFNGPVLIVSHQATLRVLYAYLTDRHPSRCPWLEMPLHTVVQITPKAYGVEEVRHVLYDTSPSH